MIRERRLPGLATVSWMDGDPIRDNKSLEPITSLDVSPSGGVEMDDDPMRARREGGAEAAEGTDGRKGPFAREGSKVTLFRHQFLFQTPKIKILYVLDFPSSKPFSFVDQPFLRNTLVNPFLSEHIFPVYTR